MHANIAGWLLAGAGALLLVGDLPGRAPAWAEVSRSPSALESTFSFAGQRRAYYVYRPSRLGASPSPLLLVLHANGADARQLEKVSRLNEAAERYGLTVVYANGDPAFLKAVVDAASGKHRIDPARIYLTAEAAGGRVAAAAVCNDPRYFSGIVLLDADAGPVSCPDGTVLRAAPIAALFDVVSTRD